MASKLEVYNKVNFRGIIRTNTSRLFMCLASLLFVVASAHGIEGIPLAVGDEEAVTLSLGSTDSEQYGRNYGRDKNNVRLEVTFTPAPSKGHRIQWQAYDIESGEMDVFLNNIKIRTVPQTSANQLGPIDQIDIPASNIGPGANVLSFRVTGGNETWGITNLRVEAIDEPGDDETATTVLLDAPDLLSYSAATRSYNFNFNFTPRGQFYKETIVIGFDTRLRNGTRNGFDVLLNGSNILRIAEYRGLATAIERRINLDKSVVNVGNNTLSIRTTSRSSVFNAETQIANVKVENRSVPLADISVAGLRVGDRTDPGKPFDMIAAVLNVGVAASQPKSIVFYRSANKDLSAPILVTSEPLVSLAPAGFVDVVASIGRFQIKSGQFYWACVEPNGDEVDVTNDCSPAIEVDVDMVVVPIMLLLNDD